MERIKLLSLVIALVIAVVSISSITLDGRSKIFTTKGIIQNVSTENQSIYIKSDKRIIKFKASKDLCTQYKDKVNSPVVVKYTKEKDKSLLIKSIVLRSSKK